MSASRTGGRAHAREEDAAAKMSALSASRASRAHARGSGAHEGR